MPAVSTAQSASYATRYGQGPARNEIVLPFIVALATTNIDNANDDIGLVIAPKGFVVTAVVANATDMDDGIALVWDLGDAADEDRLVAAATTGQAAGTTVALAVTGLLYKYTADTVIRLYIATAAGTPVAGTFKGYVRGFIDENFSTTAMTPF